jgi:regulator of sirC expression with transglutaminase-like and TPR domain
LVFDPRADRLLFEHVVGRAEEEVDLGTAALVVGEFEYPELDVAHYLSVLDRFAERAAELAAREEGRHTSLRALNRALFEEAGFRGNSEDYYDPKNSFLNEVIDRRTGIPLSLSIVYLEVGRRLGLELAGLNFPGHFVVRYQGGDQVFVLDPFHMGMTLPVSELKSRLKQVVGTEAELKTEHLEPATKRQIISRMLINLSVIYRRAGDIYRHIAVVERLLILEPDNARLQRELKALKRRAQGLN